MNPFSQFANGLVESGDAFFQQYNEIGRPFLNILHSLFQNLFEAFLIVLAAVSFFYLATTLYVIFRKKEPYKEMPLTGDLPFVTVQIPTKNELAAIRCAERCLEFDYPKDRYEILIGDDSENADVSRQVDEFAKKHSGVKVFRRAANEGGYKAGNLNNLLRHSKGEFLVLFDSDFTPGPDFLRRVIAPMVHDSRIGGVQARWKFINAGQNPVSVLGATIVASVHQVALPFVNRRRRLSILCGSAEAVRKDVLVKLGGWQHGSLTEDIEYSLRLLKNNYRIQYLPSLECGSEVPYKPRDLYRQQMRWAYGVISAAKGHFNIFTSGRLGLEERLLVGYVFSGYLFSSALFAALLSGVFSIITHQPEPVNFSLFFLETGRNVLITSGLLATGAYAISKSAGWRKIGTMIVSSLTYGLVVTYYVNIGIFKAIFGRSMEWFLLSKQGNQKTYQ